MFHDLSELTDAYYPLFEVMYICSDMDEIMATLVYMVWLVERIEYYQVDQLGLGKTTAEDQLLSNDEFIVYNIYSYFLTMYETIC